MSLLRLAARLRLPLPRDFPVELFLVLWASGVAIAACFLLLFLYHERLSLWAARVLRKQEARRL